MRGFFEIEKPKAPRRTKPKASGCEGCGLYKEVHSPKMPVTGEGRLKALIIGEAPGKTEDQENKQFVGDAGKLLRKYIRLNGYDLDRDFWKTNAVCCRTTDEKGNNRTPTKSELQCCEPHWRKEIEQLKPRFILLMGAKAVEAFFMYRSAPITSDLSIGRWVRQCIPDVQTGAWVIPLYHPSFAVRTPDFEPKFAKDLKWGLDRFTYLPPRFPDWKEFIQPLTNFIEVESFLMEIINQKPIITLDYETSGLHPYKEGHHIWSASMSLDYDDPEEEGFIYGYSFPYSYPGHWNAGQFKRIRELMIQILSDPEILKIAQNIPMEESWSRRIIGVPVQGWLHDTMICSHLINEHKKFTGLDYQVFINWGFEYSEAIEPYKKGDENGFNQMHKVPLRELLEYGAFDALFEGMLYSKQREVINDLT